MFSGGGLGDYGLELAGMTIIAQVELDDYCQKILKLRWPDVPKWTDIKNVTGKEIVERCGAVDLIAGGFPCQDISQANSTNTKGIEGARSGLWKEMFRIICDIRPCYVFVENVAALLYRGLGVILGDLAEGRYDAEWDCIPASAFGANHQRDRIWIVAYDNSQRFKERWISESIQKKLNSSKRFGKMLANSESMGRSTRAYEPERSRNGGSSNQSYNSGEIGNSSSERFQDRPTKTVFRSEENQEFKRSNWWAIEPNVGRVAHGVSKRVDRLKLLGNGQVVQVVEWIGKRIMEFGG